MKGMAMRSTHIVASILAIASAAAMAQPLPDTAQALRTLMGPSNQPGTGMVPQQIGPSPGVPQGTMVQAKAGDTLAKIIAANMGPHPYDAKKLHQAIAAMNPQAFLKGNPNRLVAGSVIRLPSPGELHAVMSGQMAAMPMAAPMQMQPMHTPNMAPMPHTASAPIRPGYGNGMASTSNAPTGAEDFERHRGWVRFPR